MATTPTRRACGSLQAHFGLVERYPAFKSNQAKIHDFTRRCIRGEVATREGITLIPVVVHVVHGTDAENISDDQVRSQITTLNEDFRATNADLSRVPEPFLDRIADARIEFELASRTANRRRVSPGRGRIARRSTTSTTTSRRRNPAASIRGTRGTT